MWPFTRIRRRTQGLESAELSTFGLAFARRRGDLNSYRTLNQATGVARTLSAQADRTVIVYRTSDEKYVTASPKDPVLGTIEGVYRNGYAVRTVLTRA